MNTASYFIPTSDRNTSRRYRACGCSLRNGEAPPMEPKDLPARFPFFRHETSRKTEAAGGTQPDGGSKAIAERARAVILLSWAVFSAELIAAGEAVSVEREDENGWPSYTVRVAASGRLAEVKVDPLSGRVYLVSPPLPAADDAL